MLLNYSSQHPPAESPNTGRAMGDHTGTLVLLNQESDELPPEFFVRCIISFLKEETNLFA